MKKVITELFECEKCFMKYETEQECAEHEKSHLDDGGVMFFKIESCVNKPGGVDIVVKMTDEENAKNNHWFFGVVSFARFENKGKNIWTTPSLPLVNKYMKGK